MPQSIRHCCSVALPEMISESPSDALSHPDSGRGGGSWHDARPAFPRFAARTIVRSGGNPRRFLGSAFGWQRQHFRAKPRMPPSLAREIFLNAKLYSPIDSQRGDSRLVITAAACRGRERSKPSRTTIPRALPQSSDDRRRRFAHGRERECRPPVIDDPLARQSGAAVAPVPELVRAFDKRTQRFRA